MVKSVTVPGKCYAISDDDRQDDPIYNRELYIMKPQGSSINKPGSKYSPGPIIYNRSLFKMGATNPIKATNPIVTA